LAKRTAAAKDYAAAATKLTEAAATWERIQGEAAAAMAKAVNELIDSDTKPAEVAQLLGIDQKGAAGHSCGRPGRRYGQSRNQCPGRRNGGGLS
jgi:hypothetical protein